jgi:hypothetical protein
MFCPPGVIFGGTEGDESRFRALRSQTRFRRYRGRQVPFSCFALPESFSAVRRATSPVFVLCAPGLVFDGTEGVGSCIQVLHARTHFWRYRGCQVPFSSFTLPNTYSSVPRASGPVFMFCAPKLIFGGAEGIVSRFHRCRVRRVPFTCFALSDSISGFARLYSFSTIPGASGPVFMFCAPVLIFDGTKGVVSRFHVLRCRTRFRRYRGHQVRFSCFALPDSFSVVPRASGPIFMFCAPRLIN